MKVSGKPLSETIIFFLNGELQSAFKESIDEELGWRFLSDPKLVADSENEEGRPLSRTLD